MSLNDLQKCCETLEQFHNRASKINLPALLEKFTSFIKKQQELQTELKISKETIIKLTDENKVLKEQLLKSNFRHEKSNQPSRRYDFSTERTKNKPRIFLDNNSLNFTQPFAPKIGSGSEVSTQRTANINSSSFPEKNTSKCTWPPFPTKIESKNIIRTHNESISSPALPSSNKLILQEDEEGKIIYPFMPAMADIYNSVIGYTVKTEIFEDPDLKFVRSKIYQRFMFLPDRMADPSYYRYIKNPISIEMIKERLKQKHYNKNIEHLCSDFMLCFHNAKSYFGNEDGIYDKAMKLQAAVKRKKNLLYNIHGVERQEYFPAFPIPRLNRKRKI